MSRLRIAIAGAGAIGREHAVRIGRSSECVLVAFADPSAKAALMAREFGVTLYADLPSLLARETPDAVIIATPNAMHVSGALLCLEAGVPPLIEKPIAETVADAKLIAETSKRTGVPALVGHHRRHSSVLQRAREIVQSGDLGRIVAVTASATFVKPDEYFTDGPWRAQPGGGPLLINLIHEIDNLRSLVGNITEVQAFASNSTRGFAVEDTVAINLRFANGALGTFLLSDCAASPRSWEQNSGENKSYDPHPDLDCYVIAGTRGSLAVPTLRMDVYEGKRSWWAPLTTSHVAYEEVDPLQRQLAHFCAVVRREAEPLVSADEATRTLAVTMAVAEAARSGGAIAIAG